MVARTVEDSAVGLLNILLISLVFCLLLRLLVRLSPLKIVLFHPSSLRSDVLLRPTGDVHVELPHNQLVVLTTLLLSNTNHVLPLLLHAEQGLDLVREPLGPRWLSRGSHM